MSLLQCELCGHKGNWIPVYPKKAIVKCPNCQLVFYDKKIDAASLYTEEYFKGGEYGFINTSRGAIINENDLIDTLKDEKIAGAGLDVYDKEPLPQDHKLRFLPNALLLPHIGYVTAENYSKFYLQMIENLEGCLKNKPLRLIS